VQSVLASIFIDDSNGHGKMLSHLPVPFGSFEPAINLPAVYCSSPLYNSELVAAARYIMEFHWAVYSFKSGHFVTNVLRHTLPFRVTLAANHLLEGRSFFKEFAKYNKILANATKQLDHIWSSGETSPLDGYLIHGPQLLKRTDARSFWQLQASIVTRMCVNCGLSIFIVLLSPEHQSTYVTQFVKTLELASCGASHQVRCIAPILVTVMIRSCVSCSVFNGIATITCNLSTCLCHPQRLPCHWAPFSGSHSMCALTLSLMCSLAKTLGM
jgi:hypothetical protein